MIYRELSIHQRINVKSWVRHDICVTCVYHSVLLYDTEPGLPHQLADNIDTPKRFAQGEWVSGKTLTEIVKALAGRKED